MGFRRDDVDEESMNRRRVGCCKRGTSKEEKKQE